MPSDFEPVCPKCGDLNPPGWRVCETCGSYLLTDDAKRDLLVRLGYARKLRLSRLDRKATDDVDVGDAGR